MKNIRKWLIGALAGTAIIAGSIALTKSNKEPPKREPVRLERTISWTNPQSTLEEAFRLANPKHISHIVYDPEFTHSDIYVNEKYKLHSTRLRQIYVESTREIRHDLGIIGLIDYTGDGELRPTFARKSVTNSPGVLTIEDLANAIAHEDVHAEEERFGYEFGDKRISSKELRKMFNSGQIRTEVITAIGELDAYAAQLEAGNRARVKPSLICTTNATINLYRVYGLIQRGLSNNTLTDLERVYTETKISKHKDTIESLKSIK